MKSAFRRRLWVGVVVLLITLVSASIVYASGSSAEGQSECPMTAGCGESMAGCGG